MRTFKRVLKSLIVCASLLLIGCSGKNSNPNLLFIAVDDLRPELGAYGKQHIKSPNIDQFASAGVMFTSAYCNIPVCGASRSSILTGIYPNRTRFTTYKTYVDEDAPGVTTLPEHFKENGYFTTSYGKVFHHLDDALQSWSETPWRPDYPNDIHIQEYWRDYRSPENLWTKDAPEPAGAPGPAWEKADVSDSAYYDGKVAERTIAKLDELAKTGDPFFLGVGFVKPHLPFNAPTEYWEMYSREEIELAPNPFMPENAPKESFYNYGELRAYTNIPNDRAPLDDETATSLRHGYYACVSYVDALIGRVLKKLEETGLADNTIVVLWGDHGWSLGEHTHWCKHTCFHNSLHVPLLVKAPGIEAGQSDALVSFVDVYPTLCELAGLEMPEHLQGESFVEHMRNKGTTGGVEFCRYPNGESIVTDQYVYTEYYDRETEETVSRMLYDHARDPQENANVAADPEYKNVVQDLSKQLRNHLETVNGH